MPGVPNLTLKDDRGSVISSTTAVEAPAEVTVPIEPGAGDDRHPLAHSRRCAPVDLEGQLEVGRGPVDDGGEHGRDVLDVGKVLLAQYLLQLLLGGGVLERLALQGAELALEVGVLADGTAVVHRSGEEVTDRPEDV